MLQLRECHSREERCSCCPFSCTAACGRAPEARRYELVGQILAVRPDRNELVIKHQDIKGFMPGMTMPFKVREAALLSGRQPGDLVTATLVVEEVNAYLSTLTVTGKAPLEDAAPPPAPEHPAARRFRRRRRSSSISMASGARCRRSADIGWP